ncbi:MAG TPA: sulfite exporter TauE/SafE family protein [Coleofasciculaceae cyanobacterium]
MINSGVKVFKLDHPVAFVLQVPVLPVSAGVPPLIGSQILAALVVGLLTAFAFQLLLTTFGVAVGMTALGFRMRSQQAPSAPSSLAPASTTAQTIAKVGTAAGLGILITINTVLFAACFLAAKFTQIGDPVSGAIIGIVIWSGYFLILTWVSSATVTSLVGSFLGSATAGFRRIVAMIGDALSGQEEVLTEAGAIALVRQEVRSALQGANLEKTVQEYLETVAPPPLDLTTVQQGLAEVLQDLDLPTLAKTGTLPALNRQTFVDVIQQHTPLSPAEVEVVVNQLQELWQQLGEHYPQPDLTAQLTQFLQTADPAELTFDALHTQLETWLAQGAEHSDSFQVAEVFSPLANIDFQGVMRSLLNRLDLSDWDVEAIWGQLQKLKQQVAGTAAAEPQAFNTIRTDLEDYLLHAYPWHLTAHSVKSALQEILYDPEADPEQVRSQLEQFQSSDFGALLEHRGDLTAKQIHQIIDRLEKVRLQVLETVTAAELEAQSQYLNQQLGTYLQSIDKAALDACDFVGYIKDLLTALDIRPQALSVFSSQAAEWLEQRPDLTADEVTQVSDRLQRLSDRLVRKTPDPAVQPLAVWHQIESYLRHTSAKKLTPERVERKLRKLLQGVREEIIDLDLELPKLQRQDLMELLTRRKSLDQKQREQILDQVEAAWNALSPPRPSSPSPLDSLTHQIVEQLKTYIVSLDGITEGIDLSSISQRFSQWLTPLAGGWTIQRQLSQLNWTALADQLQQILPLTDDQTQPILAGLRLVVRQILKKPRRWASRSLIHRQSVHMQEMADVVQDYLQHAEKSELHPVSIQRSLSRVLNPKLSRAETSALGQLSPVDRAQIKSWLRQRPDLTAVEIDAIAPEVESVCQLLCHEAEQQQQQAQSGLSQVLAKIGSYLESLNGLPLDYQTVRQNLEHLIEETELNWGDVSQTLQSLTDGFVSQVGQAREDGDSSAIPALRDRLYQFSQETILGMLKSQKHLSATVQTHLQHQVEGLRDRLMQQVEYLQQETQNRLHDLKQQAQNRLEETRRAAATAAWWLFAIASTAAATSAMAGAWAASFNAAL